MQKLVIKKSVANQITSKLKTHKNDDIMPEFAENLQKSDLYSENGNYFEINYNVEKSNPNHDAFGRFTFGKKLAPNTGINGGSSTTIPKKTHTEKIMNVDITDNKGNVSTKSLKVKDFVEDKINNKQIGYKYPSLKSKTEKRKFAVKHTCKLIDKTEIKIPDEKITKSNCDSIFREKLQEVINIFKDPKRGICPVIDNKKVILKYEVSGKHVTNKLSVDEKIERAEAVRFIPEIVEKEGHLLGCELVENRGYADIHYELIGKCKFSDGTIHRVSVVVADKGDDLLHLTIYGKDIQKSFRHDTSDGIFGASSSIVKNLEANSTSFSVFGIDILSKSITSSKVDKSTKGFSSQKLMLTKHSLTQQNNLSSKNVTKSLFTDWKVELHHLCDKKGLDYDSIIQKYDEDKCMLCFENAESAKKAYMKQYDRPGFFGSMETLTVEQFKSFIFSKQGSRIHKSFDVCITDITENNKQKKYEQLEKALNAIYENKPFAIKHIQSDNKSTRYDNLYLRFTNFDKDKIEKALHKVSLSLDTNMKTVQGEKFLYKAEEELTDKLFRELSQKTLAIYNFVISYFDLPDIRIVSKAKLKWKGKVIYNPENGKPISTKEWQRFITELEKFLNRNYSGIGEKIVLSGEALGAILERLSKTNSLSAIKKMHLSELKIKRKDVDWISESVKNLKDVFGESITRERAARIQVAIDSAAQRVTRVKDDMRNNIQQIIIDGVRDKSSKSVVAQNLFDKCASLNRDMQRIADTELQIATNTAYIKEEVYNTKPEEKVYFERYEVLDDNTCKKCQKLKGAIALWSDVPLPNERIKDPYAKYAIWEGKLDGDAPIATVHPWCRGSWVRVFPELL